MAEARSKLSSGTLLYRLVDGSIEVLLVHPAGNYNRRAPWGIPKGAPDPQFSLAPVAGRLGELLVHLGYVALAVVEEAALPIAGDWELRIEVLLGEFDLYTETITVPIEGS